MKKLVKIKGNGEELTLAKESRDQDDPFFIRGNGDRARQKCPILTFYHYVFRYRLKVARKIAGEALCPSRPLIVVPPENLLPVAGQTVVDRFRKDSQIKWKDWIINRFEERLIFWREGGGMIWVLKNHQDGEVFLFDRGIMKTRGKKRENE